MTPQFLEEGVRQRHILAGCPLGLVEVGHGIKPQPVHAQPQPEVDDLKDRAAHGRVVEVEVGLVS